MTKSVLSLALLVIAWALPAVPAQAQTRVFVAAQGSDSNPCTFAAPCRTFQHAHDVVAANGEIDVLDPAGYGAVTITKAISIQGHGFSGVSATGGVAITINAGATDTVSLRGLLIDGAGTGGNGIVFNSGAVVKVQDSVIRKFSGDGIEMVGNLAANTTTTFTLSNTLVSGNGGNGIYVQPSGGTGILNVVLNRVELYNNSAHGFAVVSVNNTGPKAAVTDSVAAGNGLAGFVAAAAAGSNGEAFMFVKHSTAAFNNVGFQSDFSHVQLTDTATYRNLKGWVRVNLGVLDTYGDNVVEELNTDGGSSVAKK